MASPALASTTPSAAQLPIPATQLLQAGSILSLPGLTGILQVVPASSLLSGGGLASVSAVVGQATGAASGVSGVTGAIATEKAAHLVRLGNPRCFS